MDNAISRRGFVAGTAAAVAGLCLPRGAFAANGAGAQGAGSEETGADGAGAADVSEKPIVILHTNDTHCQVGVKDSKTGTLSVGFSALAAYMQTCKSNVGADNVTLVDAGDAVQGQAIGTLTQGTDIVDLMNDVGYDIAIPGNHEFDFGMAQFDKLAGMHKAKYISCNFYNLKGATPVRVFEPGLIKEYSTPGVNGGTTKVGFVGATTPATLTQSSPKSFWTSDDDHTCAYGFPARTGEDPDGKKLYDAVQQSVDELVAAGADYVVLIAHLGQTGAPDIWRSDVLVKNTVGIDVVIDGHSHEEYVEVVSNKAGKNVIITQTGTLFSSIGQVTINPVTGEVNAATPNFEAVLLHETADQGGDPSYKKVVEFGRDSGVQSEVDAKMDALSKITGQVAGTSQATLYALEDDNYTWAVRAHETNLGDFVTDAYLYFAYNAGVMADFAFCNGGGIRANINEGEVTKGDLINVNPFNNQLCYTTVKGQDVLDALELSVSSKYLGLDASDNVAIEGSGGFLQVSEGFSFVARVDIPTPCVFSGTNLDYIDSTMERRVRDVKLYGKALDPQKDYTLVLHSYYLIDGGNSYGMLAKNDVELLGLDNDALMEYLDINLANNTIPAAQYGGRFGAGRIVLTDKATVVPVVPDPENPDRRTDDEAGKNGTGGKVVKGMLPATGDNALDYVAAATALGAAAVVAGGVLAKS